MKKVYIGGLMRCCLATIHEYAGDDSVGTEVKCKWCPGFIVSTERGWEWEGYEKATAREGKK